VNHDAGRTWQPGACERLPGRRSRDSPQPPLKAGILQQAEAGRDLSTGVRRYVVWPGLPCCERELVLLDEPHTVPGSREGRGRQGLLRDRRPTGDTALQPTISPSRGTLRFGRDHTPGQGRLERCTRPLGTSRSIRGLRGRLRPHPVGGPRSSRTRRARILSIRAGPSRHPCTSSFLKETRIRDSGPGEEALPTWFRELAGMSASAGVLLKGMDGLPKGARRAGI